jgi:16S rRNA G966 N2-methylase RsmD
MEPINNFLGVYYGNKKQEIKHFEEYLPNDDEIKTVVEPFAGSFALSRMKYYDYYKHSIHINDNSEEVKEVYDLIKNKHDDLLRFVEDFNNFMNQQDQQRIDKSLYNEFFDKIDYLSPRSKQFLKNSYSVRGVTKKFNINFNYENLNDYLNNIRITYDDYRVTCERYRKDKLAFLFFDPPYLDSFNQKYDQFGNNNTNDKNIVDNTYVYIYLHEYIKKCKCKVMIIINKNSITDFLFKKYIKHEYAKTYQATKRKTVHLVITNY